VSPAEVGHQGGYRAEAHRRREERLRELGFFCMERWWLRGRHVASFYYLMESYREERLSPFSKVCCVREEAVDPHCNMGSSV